MNYKVSSAIIMAAGTSSRFAPISYEKPKALIEVKGEILIERQIRQLQEKNIPQIVIVTGYKSEQFDYLKEKYGVIILKNMEYNTRNNNSSIYVARDYIKNSYICSADNYFAENPFEETVDHGYYAALYSRGYTNEWCLKTDDEGLIKAVTIGGHDSWYMLGHTFWDENFSKTFLNILEKEYNLPETTDLLWESIYLNNIDKLNLKIRKYNDDIIFEFDTLDELREFDISYITNTRSSILKKLAKELNITESKILNIKTIKSKENNTAIGFNFTVDNSNYSYTYNTSKLTKF
ncbi:MAG: NTP transferase domain-containing protein [Eubacteriales bacterium]|nr:NTP transferase domain-containing protein [Eubacteriales bacterium]MDY3332196.1 NTP transferase domain-containing protein [Gallibacter sp.]